MEDYEVRDVMNRRKTPDVRMIFTRIYLSRVGDGSKLFFRIENTSTVLAKHVLVSFDVPPKIGDFKVWVSNSVFIRDDEEGAHWRMHGYNEGQPLFPKSTMAMQLLFKSREMENPPAKILNKIRYKIFADEMPFVEGTLELSEIVEQFMPSVSELRG